MSYDASALSMSEITRIANCVKTPDFQILDGDQSNRVIFTPSRQLKRRLERNRQSNLKNHSRPVPKRGIRHVKLVKRQQSLIA